MRPPLGVLLASLPALGLCLAGRPALAANACVDAYERAQELRLGKKLVRAREQLAVCADPSCPAATKKDCSAWLKEVERSLPTLVVVARDPSGTDLAGARVIFDGAPVLNRTEGAAVPIDPGLHQVRCELEGRAPRTVEVMIQEGEKGRVLACVLTPEAPKEGAGPRVPVGAIVAGGLGVIALGLWAGYGIAGIEARARLQDSCAPQHNCPPGEVDAAQNKLRIADGALGVGLAALGVATVLFFVQRSSSAPPRPAVTVTPIPGGARLGLSARF
jgi:hypothetical protein